VHRGSQRAGNCAFPRIIGPGQTLTRLGARLSAIEQGFAEQTRAELDSVISGADVLVVVGYSGLDYFDVDPYWRMISRSGLMRGRSVVWVRHCDSWGPQIHGPACRQRQLAVFEQGGATAYEVLAPTREFLDELTQLWGLPRLAPPPLPFHDRHSSCT